MAKLFNEDEMAKIDSLIEAIHFDYVGVACWTRLWRIATSFD